MAVNRNPERVDVGATIYQIRIKGHLGTEWIEWFGGMSIVLEANGDSLVTGAIVDQSQLHGLLKKVRDLGLPLISVLQVGSDEGGSSDVR
jgi:hypothetical protein